ncbi:hypothetical protein Nepgr_027860 [Nepenthes gracilis]|uniref:Uncharacterized protein n=1 Tax=Nepenthes gracilis TaxID=150966 RepID=A0AAD3TAW0_NEPGR|nr:hypothetical protein Nepgr_027860 [Nepenthes gracilis]
MARGASTAGLERMGTGASTVTCLGARSRWVAGVTGTTNVGSWVATEVALGIGTSLARVYAGRRVPSGNCGKHEFNNSNKPEPDDEVAVSTNRHHLAIAAYSIQGHKGLGDGSEQ